jgi:acetyltransferase-like isoleucine patch superfamily enzyme
MYGHASDYAKTHLTLWQQIDPKAAERVRFWRIRLARVASRLLGARQPHVTVGRHTYGVTRKTVIGATADCPVSIGSFCSIAEGVRIVAKGNHPIDLPSTFPFRTLVFSQMRGLENFDATGAPVGIGHDVWIGQNAIILAGVNIGTGSVIGAGAVVAKDVPPYSIVAGNPSKVLRSRFSPEDVESLLRSEWWSLSDKVLQEIDYHLYSKDIVAFVNAARLARS